MSKPILDATATATPATAPSLSWNHTCGAGVAVDGGLVAWCFRNEAIGVDPLLSATHNGIDAIQLTRYSYTGTDWVYFAKWDKPAAGTHPVVFDFGAVSAPMSGGSASCTNAAQGNLNAVQPNAVNAQASFIGSITPTIAECWIGMFASNSLEIAAAGNGNNTLILSADKRATLVQYTPDAAAGIEVYPYLTISANGDWRAISFCLGPYVAPPAPPPPGNPNTSRAVITKPTLPVLGAAPYSFTHPIFGTPTVRVTDRLTGFALTGDVDHSWSPPSAVSQRGWASDSTHFYVMNRNGAVLIMDFNPTTKVRTERQILGGSIFGEPSFSRTNPNYLYGPSGNNHKLLKRADLSVNPATYTTVFDAEVLIPALSVGDTYLTGGFTCDNDVIVCAAGGSNQDLTQYVIWYPFSAPGDVKILNTRTRTELFKTYGVGPTLHAAQPDTSGRYVLLRVSAAQQLDGNITRSDWGYIWDTTLDTITELTASTDGHYALGYGFMVNQAIKAGSPYDDRQWVLRDLATPNTVTELIVPIFTPVSQFSEDHTSLAHSKAANPRVSAISLTYRDYDGPYAVAPLKNTEPWGPLDEEILGIPTNGQGGPVKRYGHTRTLTWPEPIAYRGGALEFYAVPLFNVSPDGQFLMYNSNQEHTLGLCAHDYDPSIHRTDVFIADLVAETPVTPPSPVFRRRRGRRAGSR